jgi:hypothetical protein
MREFQTHYTTEIAMKFAARTATANGEIIDFKDCDAADFAIFAGAVTTADATNFFGFKLVHGAAADLSDAADVPADDMIVNGTPGGALPKINATTQLDSLVGRISYRGTKRYGRLVATETLTADAVFGAICNKFRLGKAPA